MKKDVKWHGKITPLRLKDHNHIYQQDVRATRMLTDQVLGK